MKKSNIIIIASTLVLVGLILCLSACKKDEPVEEIVLPQPEENRPPDKPKVEILQLTGYTATLNCGNATDPDKDKLYYTLLLEDSIVIDHSETSIFHKFEGLRPNREYHGKILVSDSINPAVVVNFSFTTLKYFTRFSNVLTSTEGKTGSGLSIDFTDDGGYIVLGTISTNEQYVYVVKIDSAGYEQWSHFYDIHHSGYCGDIIRLSNNNYVFVIDEHIVMIDALGEIIWHHAYEGYTKLYEIIETEDQNLMAAGLISDQTSLVKYSFAGNEIWSKHYHNLGERYLNSFCQTHDDQYALFGTTRENDESDFWIMKVDQQGEVVWEKIFEDPDHAFAEQIILSDDQGFVLAGQTWGNYNLSSARILKTDEDGNLSWDQAFLWGTYGTYTKDIVQNPDGTYMISGYSENGSYTESSYQAKLYSTGDLYWKRDYNPSGCLDYVWRSRAMKLCPDGGIVATGIKAWVWSGCEDEPWGIWVFKTDENGYYNLP